jgi:phage terminase large subunit
LILASLVELVRDHTDIFNDERTLREMLTMVKKENGKQEAEEGYHDDKVMSIAISHNAVSQVDLSQPPIRMPEVDHFGFARDKKPSGERGCRRTVI